MKKISFNKLTPFLFVLPAIVINAVFFILPFIQALIMSFYNWPLLGTPKYIGIQNYTTALNDKAFMSSMLFTLKYAIFVTPCLFVLAFILASLVNAKTKVITLFRSIYFLPVVISMASCSLIWLWIYNDLYGILNYFLLKIGFLDKSISWMSDVKTSLPAILFMVTWKMAGFSMLIILSAFQSIDESVFEASSIDGATKIQQFFKITLPIIRPNVGLALIISVIGSVLAFEQFLIMTKGGPAQATTTAVLYIYRTSFKNYKLGLGSAMTMIMLSVLLILTFFQSKLLKDPTGS